MWDFGEKQYMWFLPWMDLPDSFWGSAREAGAVRAWLRQPHRDPWRLDEAADDKLPGREIAVRRRAEGRGIHAGPQEEVAQHVASRERHRFEGEEDRGDHQEPVCVPLLV